MASTQSPNQSVKLPKRTTAGIIPPAPGQSLVRDQESKGFGLRITANGVQSFFVEKRIDGKVKRLTLRRFGGLTAEQARKEA